MSEPQIDRGRKVRVSGYGVGEVQADLGPTVIVRFANVIQECQKCDVVVVESITEVLATGGSHAPLGVVLRIQAEAICSINSAWGVFARSRMALLPHQLWVCRKVLETWPARWLVADDVGLGKTIEAGLILSALISRDKIRRLLIICPAALVEQWQYRLRTMFDIRTSVYVPQADTDKSDFWNTNPQLVASLQTLRLDSNRRHERLLLAEPWDLVVVDEAHHLNSDDQAGPTLGFGLVQKLVESRRIRSMVFFTGTPHRGKPFGFFSLLSLLRPSDFGPRMPVADQFRRLPEIMIRNNKQNVTDLLGKPLFKEPLVESRTYSYSAAEQRFYDMLTEFILTGKMYASRLGGRDGRAVMLVLIAMQKLASSSVAAILRALRGRLARIGEESATLRGVKDAGLLAVQEEAESGADMDTLSQLDEQIAEMQLQLMADERQWLIRLIAAGAEVDIETKIDTIVKTVQGLDTSTSVLFFTEYKATQSLLMSALFAAFGGGSVTFINGDDEATEVDRGDGIPRSIRTRREEAAHQFNTGKARFLVSTEAGGEGIDLQEHCHTVIHVDLPWNPMRLHQRVGRINRYGQQHRVHVTSFRNPSTVESRIWEKLNTKIAHINAAMRQVMGDPEDMFQLVLGMTPPQMFREIFANADAVPPESFDSWFDRETSRFGDRDVIETVGALGNKCARFDFQSVSEVLPKVDLPDLSAFMQGILIYNRRQPRVGPEGMSFKTPDAWMTDPAVLPDYSEMFLDRARARTESPDRLLGVGHKVVDIAIAQATDLESCVAFIPADRIKYPLLACRVFDRVTTGEASRPALICGVELRDEGLHVLPDWILLKQVNDFSPHSLDRMPAAPAANCRAIIECIPKAIADCIAFARDRGSPFRHPDAEVIAILIPSVMPKKST